MSHRGGRTLGAAGDTISAELTANGWAVKDGFVSAAQIAGLVDCAKVRLARGEFKAARVGAANSLSIRDEVRSDHTCWLDEPLLEAENTLIEAFERLRLDLNRNAFLGLFDLELHYARYPKGAGYSRHVDQLRGQSLRLVTVILYLNPSWRTADGGQLRMFDDGQTPRDIEPRGGRLVCFLSAGREHAVLPTRIDRWSVTGWFRARR